MDILLLVLQIIILLSLGLISLLWKNSLSTYLSEKGKNLATKEDISAITIKVESVKTEYAKIIEEIRNTNQLKFAEIEREKNIRKEVYLEAAVSLSRTIKLIASLANMNKSQEDIDNQLAKDSANLIKFDIVSSESTIEAISEMMSEFDVSYLKLSIERRALLERKDHIDTLEKLRLEAHNEILKYIAMMKSANLDGNIDSKFWERINKQIEIETNQRDNFQIEINKLLEQQQKEHLIFAKKCIDKFFEISANTPKVVLAVRKDLDLPISDETYTKVFHNHMQNVVNNLNDILDDSK